jgi:small subunit ribosomal protein S6
MRDYELTFIVRSQADDEALNSTIDKVKGWIEADGGSVTRVDQWGKRRLAYPIKKEHEGHYVFMLAQLDMAQVVKVERNLRLAEEILRFLFVRVEEEPAKPEAAAVAEEPAS